MTRAVLSLFGLLGTAALCGCPAPPPNGDAGDDGSVIDAVDPSCGPDGSFPNPTLAPPPEGQGIQLHVSFEVPPGSERQQCYRFRLPSDTDLEVVRYEVAYNSGSHHMNLFRVLPSVEATHAPLDPDTGLDGDGVPCFNAVDFSAYDLVVGSQVGNLDWHLPDGVAYRLHAHSEMLLQSHFVNAATQCTPGNHAEVYVNLWTAQDPSTIREHLATMFANNRSILLPPHAASSFQANCPMPNGGTLVAMTGHFHSRGRRFSITRDEAESEMLYQSPSWSEPPFTVLSTPVQMNPNDALFYRCDFFNNTDFPITFGPHVEFEEHCNLFAYFHGPAVDPDSRAIYCF